MISDFYSLFTIHIHHSLLKLLTGLAIAAFIDRVPIVVNAIKSVITPAPANIHHAGLTW